MRVLERDGVPDQRLGGHPRERARLQGAAALTDRNHIDEPPQQRGDEVGRQRVDLGSPAAQQPHRRAGTAPAGGRGWPGREVHARPGRRHTRSSSCGSHPDRGCVATRLAEDRATRGRRARTEPAARGPRRPSECPRAGRAAAWCGSSRPERPAARRRRSPARAVPRSERPAGPPAAHRARRGPRRSPRLGRASARDRRAARRSRRFPRHARRPSRGGCSSRSRPDLRTTAPRTAARSASRAARTSSSSASRPTKHRRRRVASTSPRVPARCGRPAMRPPYLRRRAPTLSAVGSLGPLGLSTRAPRPAPPRPRNHSQPARRPLNPAHITIGHTPGRDRRSSSVGQAVISEFAEGALAGDDQRGAPAPAFRLPQSLTEASVS